MQSDHQEEISASTLYRYQLAHRQSQLEDFLKFKNQYRSNFSQEDIKDIKKIYHHGIIGRNVNQHTVIIDRVGTVKLNQLNKILSDDQFVAYINQRMLHLSENILKQKEQIIWIVDLAGPILQLASKRVYSIIQRVIGNMHKYFPHMLHRMYFVNTPMLFDTIWNKINPKVNQSTQEKIMFVGDEYEQLYVDVDPVILPEFLGGNCSNKILQQLQREEEQKLESPEEDEQDQPFDMNELKAALSGLKIGAKSHGSVAQTPLNTENDEYR